MSLELNRKSSTCKYLPRFLHTFDLWSKYLTTTAVQLWRNQIFTNLPKEPELRDLSHKHNCKKLPYFEDFLFFPETFCSDNFQDEMGTPQKWPLKKNLLNLTQMISFPWEVSTVSHFFDWTRWRKNWKKDTSGCCLQWEQTISKLLSPPFRHLLNTLSPGSLPIFMLTCRITLSERGILNLKFQNESRQACQLNESLHKAVRIFWPKLETLKPPSTIQKVSFFILIVLLSNLTYRLFACLA